MTTNHKHIDRLIKATGVKLTVIQPGTLSITTCELAKLLKYVEDEAADTPCWMTGQGCGHCKDVKE